MQHRRLGLRPRAIGHKQKIARQLAVNANLRSHAGIIRAHTPLVDLGPIAARPVPGPLGECRIHRQMARRVRPFDIGAEAHVIAQIERHMHAQPVRLRHRIDQLCRGRRAGDGGIIALRVQRLEIPPRAITAAGVIQGHRAMAGAVHDPPGAQPRGGAVRAHADHRRAIRARLDRRHTLTEGDATAGGFRLGEQGHGEGVAVDDAGHRHMQGRRPGDGRRARLHLVCFQPGEVRHAVGLTARHDAGQGFALGGVRGHHQLAAAPVRQIACVQIRVQALAPGRAQHRLVRTGRVVKPRVDDLAVARGGVLQGTRLGLEQDDVRAIQGEGARRGDADHAGTDDDGVAVAVHRPAAGVSGRPA